MPEFQISLKKILVKKMKEATAEDNGVSKITLCKSGSLWHVFGFVLFFLKWVPYKWPNPVEMNCPSDAILLLNLEHARWQKLQERNLRLRRADFSHRLIGVGFHTTSPCVPRVRKALDKTKCILWSDYQWTGLTYWYEEKREGQQDHSRYLRRVWTTID